ncbi:MAG TPA: glycine cleavage system aminomethyltransferase GcvT [Tepidisphaeraceae bacterium]|nr:glycine cleavage system aminomethyltransferase GcvT [Tepidisphaeraceae bacterium]
MPAGSGYGRMSMLKRTPFYDFHVKAGARMVEFAGWEMPVMYRSIVDEHNHTRNSGSLFDVSHMGRLHFKGKDALKFLDLVCTRSFDKCEIGQSKYSLVCNEKGGVLDDVIVGRDHKHWIMVCNASNREKLIQHFQTIRRTRDMDLDIVDQTEATAMVALQGPKIIEKIGDWLPTDVKSLKRFRFESNSFLLVNYTVFRSGYTGEDGIEMIFSARVAGLVMSKLAGRFDRDEASIKPAGLGARDTLRLEAGMPLYGHEIHEGIDPISAGLSWAVSFEKEFIGSDVLRNLNSTHRLVGLELDGKRIARQGAKVILELDPTVPENPTEVGDVTSGTFSPTLSKSIAMAFVRNDLAKPGQQLAVDLRGEANLCKVVPLPFYKRS